MDFKVIVENHNGKTHEVMRVNQACFGEMAQGCITLKDGDYIKSVRYFLMNPDSLEDMKKLAKILKVEATFGEDSYAKKAPYPKEGDVEVTNKYIEMVVADMPIHDAMYKLFILRNFDKYFYGNSHPVMFTLYKEGRIKLIEAVALMNTFKEFRSQEMGAGPKVAGFANLITYNSVLVDSVTTVADFRRFIRDPNDTHPTKVQQTFRERQTGYPRNGQYICSNFVKNTPPHNTKKIRQLWCELADEAYKDGTYPDWNKLRNRDMMGKMVNALLQRKVIKETDEFFFDTTKQQTSRT